MAIGDTHRARDGMLRVELSYCPRCGTLRASPAAAAAEVCEKCVAMMEWIHSGCRRPRRRSPRRLSPLQGDCT